MHVDCVEYVQDPVVVVVYGDVEGDGVVPSGLVHPEVVAVSPSFADLVIGPSQ